MAPEISPRLTYTAQLVAILTEGRVRRVSANWTARGAQATVAYCDPNEERPQLYRLSVEPLHRYAADDANERAHAVMLLREEAVHDIWIGGPMGLHPDATECVLCERPLHDGPAAGWWARNSTEYLIAHSYCATRALRYGTAPGRKR